MRLFKVPSLLPPSLTREQRTAILQQAAQKAEDTFQEEYFKIDEWFRQYDGLYLLAYCQLYFLTYPEGVDPEVTGRLDFYPFYLEILQAFCLMQERSFQPKPLHEEAGKLLDVMGKIGDAVQFRGMGGLVGLTDEEMIQHFLVDRMRSQTAGIRNWGYATHMRKVVHSLALEVQVEFKNFYGVDPARLMVTLLNLLEIAQGRVGNHIHEIRRFHAQHSYQDVAKVYVDSFPDVVGFDADQLFDAVGRHLDSFKGWLNHYSDFRLAENLTFTLDEIVGAYGAGADQQALNSIMDKLSLQFGELRDQNKEHVVLNNPVWKKPFVKVDDGTYFSAIIALIPHYTLGLLETLISEVPGLQERYRSRKGRYLEDELERLFRESFPCAKIYRGSMWNDGAGSSGENDFTAIIDCVAIVIEAKSGLISPSASRGAPDRFKRTVRELIEEPADQANRFIKVLKSKQTPHVFQTKSGSTNTIDANGIRYYVPLTVTLEQFGSVSNLRDLVESGFVAKELTDLATVISLTDLMVVFEILELQSEKVHYLARRREFDAHIRWEGDELDILAYYLEHGFNIGEAEFSGEHVLYLTLFSKQLDPYFIGQASGVCVAKPELALTERWKKILQRLDLGKTEHWLDAAISLLNVPFSDQKKFERGFERLCSQVRRGSAKLPHNWCVVLTGPPQRQFFVAFYPHLGISRETRNSIIAEIISSQEATESRGSVCIGIDLGDTRSAYSILAMATLPNLFDTPSTEEAIP